MSDLLHHPKKTLGGQGSVQAERLLIAACARGDVSVRRAARWPVYLINGQEQPDIRPLVVKLLDAGAIVVADPHAVESLILPPHLIGA
ncbi:MAG TPA: hypothetical protein VI172_14890 [Candidatus Dormibacteraeota bacterium]